MTANLIIWGTAFALMVMAELGTMQLVSIWFAAGAAAAFAAAYFGFEIWVQLTVFVIVSFLLLLVTRPILKKFTVKNKQPTNVELDVGKTAIVIEDIDNATSSGRARLNGVDWKAVSSDGQRIPKDSIVTIDSIKGTKLHVSVLEQTNEMISGGNKQ